MSAMPPGVALPEGLQMVAGGRRAAAHLRNTRPARVALPEGSQIDVRPRRGRRLNSRFVPVVFATLKPPATFWGRFAVHGPPFREPIWFGGAKLQQFA